MTNWYISRYTTYSNKFGYINILGQDKKWRVAFSGSGLGDEVQHAFDGSTYHHRFFDTPEDAQKAIDTFTFDGVIWYETDDRPDGGQSADGEIAPGVKVELECTESWRSHGEDHETWEMTECSHKDF
jgi:hypothetical protein